MAIKQPHWIAGTLNASNTTVFWQPMGSVQSTGTLQITEASTAFKMDVGGTVRNLRVRLTTAPGGSATRTVVLRKNGVDQAVTVTLNASDTDVADTTHSFSVAAGDTLILKFAATNVPAQTFVSVVWELETADNFISTYSAGMAGPSSLTSTTSYGPLFSAGDWNTTAAQGTAVAPVAGVISSYRMLLHTAPGIAASGKSRTFVIEKNGVAQDGTGGTPNTTITVLETATSGTWSGTLNIAALDLVRVKATATNTPATSRVVGAHHFAATTSGEMAFSATPNDAPSSSAVEFNYGMGGSPVWATPETTFELPGPITSISLNGLYVTHDAALGAAPTHTYTLRKNGAATDQILHFLGTETTKGPAGGAAVSLGSSDRFAIEAFVVGTTSSTARPHIAFALGTAPFAASTLRVGQQVVETLSLPTPDVRVTQLVVETISPTQAPVLGTLAVTLGDVTVTATGTVTTPAVSGTLAVTLGALTVAATGTVTDTRTGTLAVTLDALTVTGTGVVTTDHEGTLSVTLDALTLAATGTVTTSTTTVDQYALEYVVDLAQVVYLGAGPDVCGRQQVMVWIETTSDVI